MAVTVATFISLKQLNCHRWTLAGGEGQGKGENTPLEGK